ncbi:MAG: zf-HC2 domain-containing protein [Candidatus Latescibacterota bacterium]|jgi:anti-sigma factor RsiW
MVSRALFPCTCTEAAQALIDSDLNELGPAERARLEAHLTECPTCRGQARFLERVRTELTIEPARGPASPVPPLLTDAVRARRFLVRTEPAGARRPVLRLALATAAVAAFVLAAPRLLPDGAPDTSKPAPPVEPARTRPDTHLVQAAPKVLDSLTSAAARGRDSLALPSLGRHSETGDSI